MNVSTQNAALKSPFLNAVRSYLLTFVIVALTTLLRMGLNPLLGRRAAFIVYFPALVFSAWLGGWGSGLFALVLSTLAAVYLFIAPVRGLLITNNVDLITLVIFFLVGLSVSALSASQRRAQGQAEKNRLQAESAAKDAQRSEQALQASEQRLRLALEGGGIGTWIYDLTIDRVVADAGLVRLFSVRPEDAAGGRLEVYLQAIHPEDRPRVAQAIADAVAHKDVYEAEYRVVLPDGSHRWLATRGRVERDVLGQAVSLPGVVLDVTEQVARTERERYLADLAERARGIMDPDEVIADAVRSVGEFLSVSRCIFADIDIEADTCTIHPSEYRADPSAASIVGVVSIASFGAFVVSEYAARRAVSVDDVRLDSLRAPEGSLAAYEAINLRAHVTVPVVHFDRVVSCMSVHNAEPRHWKPEEVELLKTVVERTWLTVEVIRQERVLAREAKATAGILESIADGFYIIDRDWRFRYVNAQAEYMLRRKREELLGRVIWEEFPEAVGGTFYQLHCRAMAEGITVTAEDYYAPLDAWMDMRVYPSSSHDSISVFFQNVNVRKQAEKERERLLAELQARADRESLFNRIGQALRSSLAPEIVQAEAVTLLGEALGADRCYFASYDLGRGAVTIARDWHRPDLPSIQGIHSYSNTTEMFHELYQGQNASIIQDARTALISAQTKTRMEALQLRSRISVALVEDDGLVATLTAAMADSPRAWTKEEVSLVEAVATQLRTAVEMARVTQREHRIAEQLQRALQPPTPASGPGLALADYYRPALLEAGVGGDFSDVFGDDKGITFLVVADLSGKGLAAASQVATVRHMLRFALLNGRSVAGPITVLSRTLTNHNLIVGFATLFVGRYDAHTRELVYVNCGQDAGLILRAKTGEIDALPPTGPVLGISADTEYEEQSTALEPGDGLVLYTDGLSEAGPSRSALLTGDGVAALLRPQAGLSDPQLIVEQLMAGVDAHAGSGVRDDQCLLIAVAEGSTHSSPVSEPELMRM